MATAEVSVDFVLDKLEQQVSDLEQIVIGDSDLQDDVISTLLTNTINCLHSYSLSKDRSGYEEIFNDVHLALPLLQFNDDEINVNLDDIDFRLNNILLAKHEFVEILNKTITLKNKIDGILTSENSLNKIGEMYPRLHALTKDILEKQLQVTNVIICVDEIVNYFKLLIMDISEKLAVIHEVVESKENYIPDIPSDD